MSCSVSIHLCCISVDRCLVISWPQFQDNQNKTAIQDCVGHCVNAAVTIQNPMPDGQQKRNIVVFSHRGGPLLHNHYLMLCFNHLETLKARLGSSKTHLWSLRTEGGF